MEAEFLCPDADHAPCVEDYNAEGYDIKHGFCGESVASLCPPETVDADCLRDDADDEEIGELESVV